MDIKLRTTLCFWLVAFCALVSAFDSDPSEGGDQSKDKRQPPYLAHEDMDQWRHALKSGHTEEKRYKGEPKAYEYGDLLQYLNNVGKRDVGGAEKRRMDNTRYSDLVAYLNSVGKRAGDEKVNPEKAINNPYFRRFEDAMKFEKLQRFLQRVGR